MASRCLPVSPKFKRGTQLDVNDYTPPEGEPLFSVDTNRTFYGYNDKKGAYDVLKGDVSSVQKSRFYGKNKKNSQGFSPLSNELIVHPIDMRLVTATLGTAFTIVDCVDYPDSNSSVYIMLKNLPQWDRDLDINVDITYTLDGGSSGDQVRIDSNVYTMELHTLLDGTPELTVTDLITADANNWGKAQRTTLTNLKVPRGDITDATEKIIFNIARVASDSFTGTFKLISVRFYQVFNGASYGYYMGGVLRSSGTDNDPSSVSVVNRMTFPFDSGTMLNGNTISIARGIGMGFNSSTHGYCCGGYRSPVGPKVDTGEGTVPHPSDRLAYSTIDRVSFPFDTGSMAVVGSLSEAFAYGGSYNSSLHGFAIGGQPSEKSIADAKEQIDKLNLSFDTFTKSETISIISNPRVAPGCFNSSIHGFTIGGLDKVEGIVSTTYRLLFATDVSETVQSIDLKDNLGASMSEGSYAFGACNSSIHGFTMGGAAIDVVHRFSFPFADPTSTTMLGNLSYSKSGTTSFNSSIHGYCLGGSNAANHHASFPVGNYFSIVERITFPFDTGNAESMTNLASVWDSGVGIDGVDFVTHLI